MKLSKIAAVVVVVLGVAATGGSWYTGKQAEERYQEWIGKANQSLEKLELYGIEAEIKDVEFNRHLFSSDIRYRLATTFNGESYDLTGEDKLYHGPLPLNRLSQGNFVPALASIESKITLPEKLHSLFHNKNLLGTAQNDVSYAGTVSGQVSLQPFKSERGAWDFSASEYRYELDKSGEKGYFEGSADHYKFTDPEGGVVYLDKSEYRVQFDSNNQFAHLTTGDFTMKAKNMTSEVVDAGENGGKVVAQDIVSTGSIKVENGRYIMKSSSSVADLSVDELSIGKISSDGDIDFDAVALNDFMPFLSDPERLENDPQTEIVLKNLVGKGMKMRIGNFVLENEKGKNDLTLVLNFEGMEREPSDLMVMLKAFKASSFNGKLDLVFAEDLLVKVNQKSGMSLEEAQQQAKASIEMMRAEAANSEFIKLDGNALKTAISIDNGKVVLNGREVSESELQMAMFVLMMGMGSLAQ